MQDDESRTKLIDLLTSIMGESRLARALGIPDGDVTIGLAGVDRVEAKIRTYSLIMDRDSRSITHDCGDWERASETRQLCKHVGKVLLTLPPDIAIGWVDQVHADIEKWKFRVPKNHR